MKIAIPDDYQQVIKTLDCFSLLQHHEVTLVHEHIADPQRLADALKDPEILILTRARTKITRELLAGLPSLKIISQTGKNVDHIDLDACTQSGVTVVEGKGDSTAPAELTWLLIMNGLRKLPQAIEGMKLGHWQINMGSCVSGQQIGIWGYGKIGQRIAHYAKAFGAVVNIWGSDTSRQQAIKDGFSAADSQDDFFKTSDVITLHLRLHKSTTAIVKQADLLNMKKTALFVNTSRSQLLEKGALVEALRRGTPGYAAVDVYDEEPLFESDHPLLKMSNVICTPHLGYVEKRSYELYFSIAFNNALEEAHKKGISQKE